MSTETAKINRATRERKLSDGTQYLDVEVIFTLGRGETKVEDIRKYAYPVDTTAEAIEADLQKALATRQAERDQAEAAKASEAEADEADATVAALEGMKVTQ